MQLTGKEIVEKGIIFNYPEESVQQQGVDVRVKSISKVQCTSPGVVPSQGKTKIPKTDFIQPINNIYNLQPGYYELVLEEGCAVPPNATLHFKTRSSLVRCGSQIFSGQFDAGFNTSNMGCFLYVTIPINIEVGARVAQALVFETNIVDNLYDGQWQNDSQRTTK